MSTITDNLSALTADVLAKSAEFANRMRNQMPSILIDAGHYSNDAFLLRSFVSLRSDNQGEELAMTVDITPSLGSGNKSPVSITSDLCLDDGTIVTTGPCASLDPSSPSFKGEVSAWVNEFGAFLETSETNAVDVLRELISKKNKIARRPSKS